jgi:hypothetical protein
LDQQTGQRDFDGDRLRLEPQLPSVEGHAPFDDLIAEVRVRGVGNER